MLDTTEVSRIQKRIRNIETPLPGMFQALGDANRFHMFELLVERNGLCVTDLANILGTTVSAASQHLKVLEHAGLIEKSKSGQTVCYTVRKERVVRDVLELLARKSIN